MDKFNLIESKFCSDFEAHLAHDHIGIEGNLLECIVQKFDLHLCVCVQGGGMASKSKSCALFDKTKRG